MNKHLCNTTGNCEVVIGAFYFGVAICLEPTNEKIDDPIEEVERWICIPHLRELQKQETEAENKRLT